MATIDDEAARRLDDRLREARARLDRLEERVERSGGATAKPAAAGSDDVSSGHVLFVPTAAGYDLLVRTGAPPSPGATVVPIDGGAAFVVTKVAGSPLPGDRRPCAYLQEA